MDLAVMDVSFISIKLVIPAVKALLKPDADFVCLIKPQFEAGKEEVGKKGVVRDSAVHERVINSILEFVPECGFTCLGLDYSPIKGPEGNIEYICHLKNAQVTPAEIDVKAVVAASHNVL
jgi:23S rRNA (cytidine1920-2'-O)/16S rRNA (cytidine1409-2'-O)-methyltransferase